ncbi:protein C10 isoform X1 [Cyrtonyx montezumae]|uniref:protein C10 isoform X1 n=1 Tax=Cyrtonyx montezumae TaxID=9017 RepID=UPI0032DA8DBC
MASSTQAPPPALSAEQAKVVLAEVIKAFGAPENVQRMDEARENACNDMGKMLQFLLPVATQIQQDVIKAYGFSSDGEVVRVAGPGDRQHVGKAEGDVPAPHDAAAARRWHWRRGRLVTLPGPGAPFGAFAGDWGCVRCCSASPGKLSG